MTALVWGTGFLVMVSMMSACSLDGSKTINEQYLENPQYQSFKKQADSEIAENLQRNQRLAGYVAQLNGCEKTRSFSGSFTITRQQIDTVKTIASQTDTTCTISSTLNELRFKLTAYGKSKLEGLKTLWLLLDLQAAYEDIQLLAATYKGKKMIDFRPIGVFKRNLSEQMMSEVHIRKTDGHLEIVSKTKRTIKHPIEQKNRIQQSYRINTDGTVKLMQ